MAPEAVAGPLGPSFRVSGNTTLLSPAFEVPEGGQSIVVRARGRVPVAVRARVEGEPERELALLRPGARTAFAVPLAGVEGRRVRLVLDPFPALGQSVDLGPPGRVIERLPGWSVTRGLPEVQRIGRRRALRVRAEPAEIVSDPFAVGAGAARLRVAVRGAGRVTIRAGRFRRLVRATPRWRFAEIPVDATRRSALRVRVRAVPTDGALLVRDLGLLARPAVVTGMRISRGPVTTIRGRVGPRGAGVRVSLVSGGRTVASDVADARGRWVLRTRRDGRAELRVEDPERFHPGRRLVL